MRVSYAEGYFVPLPERHPFPMAKFPALKSILDSEKLLSPVDVMRPRMASWEDLRLVHTGTYLRDLSLGTLGRQAERRMGLPWSSELVVRSRLAVQGTINAALTAVVDGIAANLAGGTHHAFPTHGEGFCVLNDVAVAIRVLQRSQWIRRALVLDLDVHQGNGTAAFFADDPSVFTMSVHGARNYPFRKEASSLDIALPDGLGDGDYHGIVQRELRRVLSSFEPDIILYLAGIDVVDGDRFGRLALTRSGLAARESMVLDESFRRSIPVVLLLSGGYAASPELTADLHAEAHRQAQRIYG